jgi:hypothetical protein
MDLRMESEDDLAVSSPELFFKRADPADRSNMSDDKPRLAAFKSDQRKEAHARVARS